MNAVEELACALAGSVSVRVPMDEWPGEMRAYERLGEMAAESGWPNPRGITKQTIVRELNGDAYMLLTWTHESMIVRGP